MHPEQERWTAVCQWNKSLHTNFRNYQISSFWVQRHDPKKQKSGSVLRDLKRLKLLLVLKVIRLVEFKSI